jgi:hypothetical protein
MAPIGDLQLKGPSLGFPTSMYPYVAPHASKIHTLITLGIRNRTKPLVLKARMYRPCGSDSHRPLHFKSTSGVQIGAGLPRGPQIESSVARESRGPHFPCAT